MQSSTTLRMITCWLVAVSLAAPASAIVIRHDRDDRLYRELGEKYPAAVSILPDGTGALIGPDWVLTAAHVARGVSSRNPRVEANGSEYEIARIFIHPDWTRGPHDIALMKLARPVEGIEPVRLYDRDDEVGQQVTFVGRGDFGTGKTGPQEMDRVKRGATNIVEETDDDWVLFTFDAPESATELEGVSGPGDSGGPAFVTRDGVLYTIGVSVFADGDDGPGRYGVREGYTRVSTHRGWVQDVLDGKHDAAGFAPGAGTASKGKRKRGPGPGGGGVAMTLEPLPDDAVGRLVRAYVEAYNTDDHDKMEAFAARGFTPEFAQRASPDERRDRYRRLRDEHLGSIRVQGMVGREENSIRVLFDSERGQMAEFRFELTGGEAPRIDGLRVALVQVDAD